MQKQRPYALLTVKGGHSPHVSPKLAPESNVAVEVPSVPAKDPSAWTPAKNPANCEPWHDSDQIVISDTRTQRKDSAYAPSLRLAVSQAPKCWQKQAHLRGRASEGHLDVSRRHFAEGVRNDVKQL